MFSVWDADSGEKVTKVDSHSQALVESFGGEGTGWRHTHGPTTNRTLAGLKSYMPFMWTTGTTYKFRVEAQPDVEKRETVFQNRFPS
jgi:hypothetical protein